MIWVNSPTMWVTSLHFTDGRVEVQRDGRRLPKGTQNTRQNSRN